MVMLAELKGRSYLYPTHTCYSLVRDYYALVLGITLPCQEYPEDFWQSGKPLVLDHFREHGFIRVPPEGIQTHDVLVFQVEQSTVPNHLAVYLGNTRMLHQTRLEVSREEVYSGFWQEATRLVLRHERSVHERQTISNHLPAWRS